MPLNRLPNARALKARPLRGEGLAFERDSRGVVVTELSYRATCGCSLRAVLNIGEGAYNDPGTRKSRYQSAAGSASEVRVGVLAAIRWKHVSERQASTVLEYYDRVLAMLYKLVH